MTYSCHPGHRLGQTDRDIKFLTDTRQQSYLGAVKDCVVCKSFYELHFLSLCKVLNATFVVVPAN